MKETLKFSGHETFHCRHFWLKKGYDFSIKNNSFSNPNAVVKLGVGKNMVASIKHWLKAFGISNEEGKLSEISHVIFDTNLGLDPFLEYDGTLWLLHYQLLKTEIASIYPLVFKDFRKSKINSQFTTIQLLKHLSKVSGGASEKTLENDIKVFLKTYYRSQNTSVKNLEDELSSIFIDLNLIDSLDKDTYQLKITEREEIPTAIFLYAILDTFTNEVTSFDAVQEEVADEVISFDAIQEKVADLFACNAEGLELQIAAICDAYPFAVYKEDAGRKALTIKGTQHKLQILKDYYNAEVYHID